MIITVLYISKLSMSDDLYFCHTDKNAIIAIITPPYTSDIEYNTLTPHLFKHSIHLSDLLNLSEVMHLKVYNKYDCALEMTSFIRKDIKNDCDCSLKGYFYNKVPMHHVKKYCSFKSQQCIEIGEDIILIAPYNNTFTKDNVSDGDLVNIIPQRNLNLKCIFKRVDSISPGR